MSMCVYVSMWGVCICEYVGGVCICEYVGVEKGWCGGGSITMGDRV